MDKNREQVGTRRPPEPKGHQGRRREKPKNAIGTIKRILAYLKNFRIHLIFVFITILISAGATVFAAAYLKPILNGLDRTSETPGGGKFFDGDTFLKGDFIQSILILLSIYLIGAISQYVYSRIMVNISTGTLKKIRCEMFSHMQTLPIKYFDTRTHGRIMSFYTNDTDTLREMISHGIPQFLSSLTTVIGVFIFMVIYSWRLTLVACGILCIMLFVVKKVGGKSASYFIKQQQALGEINGYIEEMTEGQKVVKVFCHEDETKKNFDEINEKMRHASANANTFANILMPIMGNLSHALYALCAMIGTIFVIKGVHDVGTVIAFLQFTRSFSLPITQISQQFNSILTALAGAERIFGLLDEESEVDDGYVELVNAVIDENGNITETAERTGAWAWKHPHHDGTVTYTQLLGDVQFENVTFGYVPEKTVLKNVSLYAKPGQKIAFVGSTGAGKTTITNLINRFYDIDDGKIRYDGINIQKIKKDDLRRSLSMVLQDTHLFTGTVMENIRYGKLDATDEEVYAAAKLANADFFISHLPDGYNTVLTADGANLSQGQRQLLAIARAAVANPPVLILDEATSSIDTRTEALIERGMDTLMDGRTVFVIAHRLSTIRNSHAIMVLEQGEIIERGNHDSLIADKGKYYQLYTGMFELS